VGIPERRLGESTNKNCNNLRIYLIKNALTLKNTEKIRQTPGPWVLHTLVLSDRRVYAFDPDFNVVTVICWLLVTTLTHTDNISTNKEPSSYQNVPS